MVGFWVVVGVGSVVGGIGGVGVGVVVGFCVGVAVGVGVGVGGGVGVGFVEGEIVVGVDVTVGVGDGGVGVGSGGVAAFIVTKNCAFLSTSTMLCCLSLNVPGIITVKVKNPLSSTKNVPIF